MQPFCGVGGDDRTGDLFFEMERIFKIKKRRVIFLENVKNLVDHDKGNTFKTIIDRLNEAGYKDKIKCQVLNACEYGDIPQNRERIYIVASRDKKDYDRFQMPLPTPLDKSIKDVFNFDTQVDDNIIIQKVNTKEIYINYNTMNYQQI